MLPCLGGDTRDVRLVPAGRDIVADPPLRVDEIGNAGDGGRGRRGRRARGAEEEQRAGDGEARRQAASQRDQSSQSSSFSLRGR
jgi:hypothetical protein